jgi:hypothetical protein
MTDKYANAVDTLQRAEDIHDEIACVEAAITQGLCEIGESPTLRAEYQQKHTEFMQSVTAQFKHLECNLFDSMLLAVEVLAYVATAASTEVVEEDTDSTIMATAIVSVLSRHALLASHKAIKEKFV